MIGPQDSDFLPLQKGLYWIYDVDETQYSELNGEQHFTYEMKVQVTDSFPNSGGTITYVLQVLRKAEAADNFEYQDTWSARVEASEVIVNEGNIPYVKLSFPLTKGKKWNGNAYNSLGGDESCGNDSTPCDIYEIESINEPYEGNGLSFTQTVNVLQNNNQDVIVEKNVRKEIYARNVGLVYKESTVLEYCTVGSCVGQQQIDSGFIIIQVLKEYGDE